MSSCIHSHKSNSIVAKEIGVSHNTFKSYLGDCFKLKLCRTTKEGHLIFNKMPVIMKDLFGSTGTHIFVPNKRKAKTLKEVKDNVRSAILLANFKKQDFIILGHSVTKSVRKKQTRRSLHAKSYVDSFCTRRGPKIKKIITSSRHAGRTIGCSHVVGLKGLSKLIDFGVVKYNPPAPLTPMLGSTYQKLSFAETNLPFKGCKFALSKFGVLFFQGREVNLTFKRQEELVFRKELKFRKRKKQLKRIKRAKKLGI